MLKTKAVLEVELGGKLYQLYCDNDAPLGVLHDALLQMKGFVVEKMIAAQKEEQGVSDAYKAQQEAEDRCEAEPACQ